MTSINNTFMASINNTYLKSLSITIFAKKFDR